MIYRDGRSAPLDSTPDGTEVATFAAGCFWGVEAASREIEGVVATRVGYTGGQTTDPTYAAVCSDASRDALQQTLSRQRRDQIVVTVAAWTDRWRRTPRQPPLGLVEGDPVQPRRELRALLESRQASRVRLSPVRAIDRSRVVVVGRRRDGGADDHLPVHGVDLGLG